MSKASEGQARSLIASFAVDTPWNEIETDLQPFIELSPKKRGERFAAFLRNGGKEIIGEPKIISVNRGQFKPKVFIGEGWNIVNKETDPRSVALTELDLNQVELVTKIERGEKWVQGEKHLKRLKKGGRIRLDADVFITLWHNQYIIPESWKEVDGKRRHIFFDGTVIKSPVGNRSVLYLFWDRGWCWGASWLADGRFSYTPSAVI